MNSVQIQKQIITSSSSSPEGLYTILKNSENAIIDGGMCIFVITSVSVRYGILAQMIKSVVYYIPRYLLFKCSLQV